VVPHLSGKQANIIGYRDETLSYPAFIAKGCGL